VGPVTTLLLVAAGAAVGAPLRYLLDRWVQARHGAGFPWGTLAVNLLGSAVLGVVVGLPAPGPVATLLGAGLCGTFTTYSTFSYETVRLLTTGAPGRAAANVALSLAGGLAAAYGGLGLAGALR
jgi:CrcB protein